MKILICHCTECRRQSSSSYGVTAKFPAFKLPSSDPSAIAVYSRPNSIGKTNGYFCTTCGSRLIHEHVDSTGKPADTVSVKAGCLDGITKEMMRSAVHIWTSLAIVDIPADAEAYEEGPPSRSSKK